MYTAETVRYAGIDSFEICNGTGFGVTLFMQGCSHHCEGCHNPSTWDKHGGKPFTVADEEMLKERCLNPNVTRLTISGGEPFESPELFNHIAAWFRKNCPGKQLWVYSGYTFEELMDSPLKKALLLMCDVLVDGPFILAKRDITLAFRGSTNQRIVDIAMSVKCGHVVERRIP